VCPEVECGMPTPRNSLRLEGDPENPRLREHFIENIFTLQRWRQFLENQPTLGKLVTFHTDNKLLILSHSQEIYRQMGKQVAGGKHQDFNELLDTYEGLLLKSLNLMTTIKKNINVLQHAMGFFKNDLTPSEKQELLTSFDQYRDGYVPLIVPLTLIKHYVLKYDHPWLKTQTYLNPHPFELKLRNYF
jgi:uncharacterized protein YbgA (DUF1722 family)